MLHYKIMRMRSFGLQHKIQNCGLQSVKKTLLFSFPNKYCEVVFYTKINRN